MSFGNQNAKAIIWMLGAMGSLLCMSLIGKELRDDYSSFQIMFYRSFISFILFYLFLRFNNLHSKLKFTDLRLHTLRNIVHFTAQNLWFYALGILPLSAVIALEFTTPAWVILISALFLSEKFGLTKLLVILLSFTGILLIFGTRIFTLDFNLMTALLSSVGFAISIAMTKALTKKQIVNEILLFMTGSQFLFSALIILFTSDFALPRLDLLHWFILIGIFGVTSHYAMTKALSLADASLLAPIDLVRLPLSIYFGWLIFGDLIGNYLLLGCAVLIIANFINIRGAK